MLFSDSTARSCLNTVLRLCYTRAFAVIDTVGEPRYPDPWTDRLRNEKGAFTKTSDVLLVENKISTRSFLAPLLLTPSSHRCGVTGRSKSVFMCVESGVLYSGA